MITQLATAAAILAATACTAFASEPFSIDTFSFDWKIASEDKASLSIVKTEETTRVLLRREFDALYLSPADAAAVGAALSEVSTYFVKFKNQANGSEHVKAGGFEVTFSKSEHGFSVGVMQSGDFAIRSVWLSRAQAAEFAPWMQKAPKMAGYLDRVLDTALAGD